MGGTLTADETPGGGLTMVVSLSAATDGDYGSREPGSPEPGSRERRPARSTEGAT
jgi:hypothetical protein